MLRSLKALLVLATLILVTSCGGANQHVATGVLEITPKYDNVGNFSEGLASVTIDGKSGFIDKSGVVKIPLIYTRTYWFMDGFALVSTTPTDEMYDSEGKFIGEYKLIDKLGSVKKSFGKGNSVQTSFSDHITESPKTYVITAWDDSCGYIDTAGNELFQNKFKSCGSFSDGLAPVEDIKSHLMGFIDSKGDWKISPTFYSVSYFSDGLAAASIESKTTKYNSGYIDRKGHWVINPQFWHAMPFVNGLARVVDCNGCETSDAYSYGLHGFINKKGNLVIEKKYFSYISKYMDDQDFSGGYAAEYLGSGWTFIDKNSKPISSDRFENVSAFFNGYALVKLNNKWGFINSKGEIAVKPQFEDAQIYSEGLAAVQIGGKWGFVA